MTAFQAFHATCRADTVAGPAVARATPAGTLGSAAQRVANGLSSQIRSPGMISETSLPVAQTAEIKPSLATLQAADRLTASLGHRREGSATSISTATGATKRKADDEALDVTKEIKRERSQ